MATCPRCKGPLTDDHRCPRRPIFVAAEIFLSAVAGAIAGLFVVALTVPQGRLIVDLSALVIGAAAAISLDRYLRG